MLHRGGYTGGQRRAGGMPVRREWQLRRLTRPVTTASSLRKSHTHVALCRLDTGDNRYTFTSSRSGHAVDGGRSAGESGG